MQETDGSEQVDGDLLEREAGVLVEIFNDAAPDYSPELEWFGMGIDHETGRQEFVFEAESYIDSDGLAAIRNHGRTVNYIEAHEIDEDVLIQINFPAQGERSTGHRCTRQMSIKFGRYYSAHYKRAVINVTDVTEIDPNADRCPWCGKARIWKGRHAAAQHPEEWEAFKDHFVREESGSVTWRKP